MLTCEQWWLHCTSQWGQKTLLIESLYCVAITLKNDWASSSESASNFVLSLNTLLWKLFRRPQLWATGDWQLHHDNAPTHASRLLQFFGKTSNHPGDSGPLQPRFGALWLLAFPQTKITFEREEISDHQWDSGKRNGAADGDWENYVRSQDAYFEGDWGIIVLYTTFLVSCFFNKCLYFSYYMAGYLLDRLRV